MSLLHTINERRLQPELMDEPGLDIHEHRRALCGLGRINFWSNTVGVLWRPLYDLQQEVGKPVRVLDLACGGGDVISGLARIAHRFDLPFEFAGCDRSATAVEHAEENARQAGVNINFFMADVLHDEVPGSFDVVMCSLFLHHLTELQSLLMLRKMADAASHLVLVNDLRRTHKGLLLAHVATRVLSRSRIVHYDGPRSVEGAYTCSEMQQLATLAGLEGATITKRWPQRFLLIWTKP